MNERSERTEREKGFFNDYWFGTAIREIQGTIRIPEVDSLDGKSILICSCGTGVLPVRAANAGGEVFAFDISPMAVRKAKEVAKFNGVSITADVMDFHHLGYPNDFFDFMYGSDILHHVDCNLAGQEIWRCLKPGGIAFFLENSDSNPILRWARRNAFGVPGGYQKRRFLVFKRYGTTDEYPLTEEEIGMLAEIFDGNIRILHDRFVFLQLLSTHGWQNETFRHLMGLTDNLVATLFPLIMKYSYSQQIWLQKPRY